MQRTPAREGKGAAAAQQAGEQAAALQWPWLAGWVLACNPRAPSLPLPCTRGADWAQGSGGVSSSWPRLIALHAAHAVCAGGRGSGSRWARRAWQVGGRGGGTRAGAGGGPSVDPHGWAAGHCAMHVGLLPRAVWAPVCCGLPQSATLTGACACRLKAPPPLVGTRPGCACRNHSVPKVATPVVRALLLCTGTAGCSQEYQQQEYQQQGQPSSNSSALSWGSLDDAQDIAGQGRAQPCCPPTWRGGGCQQCTHSPHPAGLRRDVGRLAGRYCMTNAQVGWPRCQTALIDQFIKRFMHL